MTPRESLFGTEAPISQYLRSLWVVCESISGLRRRRPHITGCMLQVLWRRQASLVGTHQH